MNAETIIFRMRRGFLNPMAVEATAPATGICSFACREKEQTLAGPPEKVTMAYAAQPRATLALIVRRKSLLATEPRVGRRGKTAFHGRHGGRPLRNRSRADFCGILLKKEHCWTIGHRTAGAGKIAVYLDSIYLDSHKWVKPERYGYSVFLFTPTGHVR